MVSLILKTSSFLYLQHFALKPKPRNFLKVLLCNTFKSFGFGIFGLSTGQKVAKVGRKGFYKR
jgi:hypothetical protein